MKKFLIISILTAAVMAVACENTVKYEYDLDDGEITLMAQLSTSETEHTVFLSMSYPDRIDSLPGATVNCFVNGELHRASRGPIDHEEYYDIETGGTYFGPARNHYTNYVFQAAFKPGDKVRIEASKGDMSAWAELEVPQPATLVSVDTATVIRSSVYQDIYGSETYDQEYLEFTIRLKDVVGSDSYFTLDGVMNTVVRTMSEDDTEKETVRGKIQMDYETFHDQILEDGYSSGMGSILEDILPENATHCFSDKLFRDGEATVHIYIPSYNFEDYWFYYFHYDVSRIEIDKTFRLSVKSIDMGFYNYLRALNNMLCYGFDVSPIIEPTMLPNNVKGGMGMVSISSEVYLDIPFGTEVVNPDDFIYY